MTITPRVSTSGQLMYRGVDPIVRRPIDWLAPPPARSYPIQPMRVSGMGRGVPLGERLSVSAPAYIGGGIGVIYGVAKTINDSGAKSVFVPLTTGLIGMLAGAIIGGLLYSYGTGVNILQRPGPY